MKNILPFLLTSFVLFSCSSPSVSTSSSVESQESDDEESSLSSVSSSSSLSSEASNLGYKDDPMLEPMIGRQYYLNHIGDIYSCWNKYRGDGVTIAVIDVGFNPYHEDFYYKDNTSKISPLSASFSLEDGRVVTDVGVDRVAVKEESHGTICAGVAAAAVNGKGIAGVAPNAGLMLLKTDANPKSVAQAFYYAADNGAKVISISIGSYANGAGGDLLDDGSDLPTVFEAPVAYCYDRNIPVISAAGNGGLYMPYEYTFPGATTHVIGVGGLAANSSGEIWDESSRNSSLQYQFCDVFAPSDMIYGLANHGGKQYDSGYKGTSFSAPQVAGLAALYFQKNPRKTCADFENDLFNTCHKITTSSLASANQLGYGRVDAGKLLGEISTATIHVQASSKSYSSLYCYAWNLEKEKENHAWPGLAMNKVGNTFSIDIDSSQYDSLIFTASGSGPQSVDLMVSSFQSGDIIYSLSSPVNEISRLVGSYFN